MEKVNITPIKHPNLIYFLQLYIPRDPKFPN
jgi:hypothetical protein